MKPFKFLKYPVLFTHHNEPVYAGEWFYSMNKNEIESITGDIVPKHTIVKRNVHPIYKDTFTPAYDAILYFKTEEEAETYKKWQQGLDLIMPYYEHNRLY